MLHFCKYMRLLRFFTNRGCVGVRPNYTASGTDRNFWSWNWYLELYRLTKNPHVSVAPCIRLAKPRERQTGLSGKSRCQIWLLEQITTLEIHGPNGVLGTSCGTTYSLQAFLVHRESRFGRGLHHEEGGIDLSRRSPTFAQLPVFGPIDGKDREGVLNDETTRYTVFGLQVAEGFAQGPHRAHGNFNGSNNSAQVAKVLQATPTSSIFAFSVYATICQSSFPESLLNVILKSDSVAGHLFRDGACKNDAPYQRLATEAKDRELRKRRTSQDFNIVPSYLEVNMGGGGLWKSPRPAAHLEIYICQERREQSKTEEKRAKMLGEG